MKSVGTYSFLPFRFGLTGSGGVGHGDTDFRDFSFVWVLDTDGHRFSGFFCLGVGHGDTDFQDFLFGCWTQIYRIFTDFFDLWSVKLDTTLYLCPAQVCIHRALVQR